MSADMAPDTAREVNATPHATDEAPDYLALLPVPLLLNSVLPLLAAPDVLRLAACCRTLKEVAFADDVWQPRCKARSWERQYRGMSWQECYTARRRTLCVECGQASRYVFALLSCRLCEKCEHASPRYGLVTALEAAERYGVPYTALGGVPYHEACRTRFYLRTTIEAMARPLGGGRGAGAQESGSEEEEEKEEENPQRENRAEEPMGPEAEDGEGEAQQQQRQQQEDESSDEEEGGAGGDAAAQRRAAEKAARKAAKKAAKEAQRAKRQGKATAPMAAPPRPSYGKIVTGTSPPTGKSRGGSGSGGGGSRGTRGAAGLFGRSPPGCRAAGPLMVQDDGDGQALPLEGQAVAGGGRRRGGGRGGGGGGGGGAGAAAAPAASGPSRTVKLKSGWAAEREALMAAWGQFGISGLVLAS